MMLFNIFVISCCVLVANCQPHNVTLKEINNSIDKGDTLSIVPEKTKSIEELSNKSNIYTINIKSETTDEFETAHKIPKPETEFHTSHKITHERPIVQLSKDNSESIGVESSLNKNQDDNGIDNLMQMQKTQNLLSTKERPELNPILSALINEDVMKSIEAKRAIEKEQLQSSSSDGSALTTTSIPETLLTTTAKWSLSPNDDDDDDENNAGLIDQLINLDEAGSENNQKSRIQIKKGPNGIDYEYEYVYYYYDEDDKNDNKTELAEDSAVKASGQSTSTIDKKEQQQRGKSRYSNIDRSTAVPAPSDNVLVSGKATGRSSIPVTEEVDEGRLPANTRFPPRSKNINLAVTPTLDVASNVGSNSESEKKKRISVKRPSLELVDSETFNTDEKQVKVNRVNSDAEAKAAAAAEKEEENAAAANAEVSEPTSDPDMEHTTPLMEKVAFDLYAILANENFNMDSSTDTLDTDATTGADTDVTTIVGESFATNPTPTTTSTTLQPTTTTTTTTTASTTTTTTTSIPPPLSGGRRGLTNAAGRNRFRLKSSNNANTVTTTTVAPASELSTPTKGKSRFQRPSFGTRSRYSTTEAAEIHAPEDVATKLESKPSSLSSGRGKTRNRFNLRGYSSTTESSTNENDVDESVTSTIPKTLRARPTLNIRGRSRISSSSTTEASLNNNENGKNNDEKVSSSSIPTRPSRFNLNRAGVGSNRLLPRGRLNTLRPTTASVTTAANESSDSDTAENKNHTDIKENENNEDGFEKTTGVASTTPTIGGLNRLKNRPRIQIQPKTDNNKSKLSTIPSVNRKVNPLLARRKLTIGLSSTTENPHTDDDTESHEENDRDQISDRKFDSNPSQTTIDGSSNKEKTFDNDTTEPIEITSEQPRGLGLLGQRRRLPLRKPGTIL